MFTKNSNSEPDESKLRDIQGQLKLLTEENNTLRMQIEDNRESFETNNSILASNDIQRQELEKELAQLKGKLKQLKPLQQQKAEQLEVLRQEKSRHITTYFSMPGLGDSYSIEDLLETAELEDEMLLFKDGNGMVWEIAKDSDFTSVNNEETEFIAIDPNISLNF